MRRLPFLLLSGLMAMAPLHADLNDKGDFQVWNHQSLRIPLTSNWSLKGTSEFRYGDNSSFFYQKYYEIEVIYNALLWLSIAPGYRQMYTRSKEDLPWTPVYIPLLDIYLYGCTANWRVTNRFRVMYFKKESEGKEWLYRNRLRLISPWQLTRLCMTPYVDDEIFFKESDGFFENRFTVGLTTPYDRSFKTKFLYRLRHQKCGSDWTYQHILGLQFAFSF